MIYHSCYRLDKNLLEQQILYSNYLVKNLIFYHVLTKLLFE